ncbi:MULTISPECIES: DUF4254 domain-containing protein [Sphingobacterium]|jgi:Protein of unknown function (DUF4254)|uniref:DUF4254 domain-containing protein n=1 Tax=Sphingobacterium multivorum TaxID=28454 RepID=A0A654A2G6_SPHMU|nr:MULTISPECIES: DUF4254 domain-containing protein [Sphingobacterium]QQT64251.1 DUF4254 domain-containing protein [Sphingobacterium multivorum]VXC61871.1 conserved hypothetical protein [Sphingobacterium multivorum]HAK28026.1 hypothetical protein [Sphingobacterium sp.]
MISAIANPIFQRAIQDYHVYDQIDHPIQNPYDKQSLEHLLYLKCWIDTVQWHMEDVVRNPAIEPQEGLYWKRRIDESNQYRTDTVEYIDSYFLQKFQGIQASPTATINTESPAWAIDRLSILALKIYHMEQETLRKDASETHIISCQEKLNVLLEQRKDLSQSIDELMTAIASGDKYMKVYKQMKMYNDPALNPVLYSSGK